MAISHLGTPRYIAYRECTNHGYYFMHARTTFIFMYSVLVEAQMDLLKTVNVKLTASVPFELLAVHS